MPGVSAVVETSRGAKQPAAGLPFFAQLFRGQYCIDQLPPGSFCGAASAVHSRANEADSAALDPHSVQSSLPHRPFKDALIGPGERTTKRLPELQTFPLLGRSGTSKTSASPRPVSNKEGQDGSLRQSCYLHSLAPAQGKRPSIPPSPFAWLPEPLQWESAELP